MSDGIAHPVPFKHSNYDYRVTLGSVGDPDSIGWSGPTYICPDWEAVNRLHEMWAAIRDEPAIRVSLEYNNE